MEDVGCQLCCARLRRGLHGFTWQPNGVIKPYMAWTWPGQLVLNISKTPSCDPILAEVLCLLSLNTWNHFGNYNVMSIMIIIIMIIIIIIMDIDIDIEVGTTLRFVHCNCNETSNSETCDRDWTVVAPSAGSQGTVCSWDKLPGGIRDMESGFCIRAVLGCQL